MEDLAIALETRDTDALCSVIDEATEWITITRETVKGAEISDYLGKLKKPSALQIDAVVTHGKFGSVSGTSHFGGTEHGFNHTFEFTKTSFRTFKRVYSYASGRWSRA